MTSKETAEKVIGWPPALVVCPDKMDALAKSLEGNDNFLLIDDDEIIGWMALQKADSWGCGIEVCDKHVHLDNRDKSYLWPDVSR